MSARQLFIACSARSLNVVHLHRGRDGLSFMSAGCPRRVPMPVRRERADRVLTVIHLRPEVRNAVASVRLSAAGVVRSGRPEAGMGEWNRGGQAGGLGWRQAFPQRRRTARYFSRSGLMLRVRWHANEHVRRASARPGGDWLSPKRDPDQRTHMTRPHVNSNVSSFERRCVIPFSDCIV